MLCIPLWIEFRKVLHQMHSTGPATSLYEHLSCWLLVYRIVSGWKSRRATAEREKQFQQQQQQLLSLSSDAHVFCRLSDPHEFVSRDSLHPALLVKVMLFLPSCFIHSPFVQCISSSRQMHESTDSSSSRQLYSILVRVLSLSLFDRLVRLGRHIY